ncbi:MAG: PIN domain-containing protein [Candidatus Saccharimonadales bacterium]
MVAVDTNILVRIYTRDDEQLYQKAMSLLSGRATGSLLLDRIILAELTYVLKSNYHYKKPIIADVLMSLCNDERFSIPDRELTLTAVALFAAEAPLSFEDCWLLALQRTGQVKSVATFDDALNKRLVAST